MEALDMSGLLTAVKEVGAATFMVVFSAYLILGGLRLVGALFKSSDDRWDDIITILQAQLQVQRDSADRIADLTLNMQVGFNQVRDDFNAKIDTLENKIDALSTEVKRLLLMIGEDHADG